MGMQPDEQGIRSAVMGLVGESEELDSPQELNAVETDPSKRYTRFDVVLGRGAYKTVYKAFDEWEGIEVAWNQVKVNDLVSQRTERERLFAEIRVLKQLKHKNIMSSFDSWLDQKDLTVNFITELFTSGTLRQYRKRHKHIDEQVVKRWAWQILQGLVYLHGHNPPIIHRDLKCDNIFVNGASGVIKIGDLGLATLWHGLTTPQSVLGTPEFMAPELYEEKYNEKVDVYSFGMCMLELTTMEYPYSECRNAAQIYKKVTSGVKPAGLSRVQSVEMREFIEHCIQHDASKRPEARQLLKSTFFDSVRGGRMSSNGSRHRMQERAPCGEAGKIPARSSSSSASDEEILPNYHNELEQHSVLGQKQLSATEGSFRHVQSLQPQHSASSSTSSYQSEAYSGGPSSQELGRHVWNKMPLQEQHQLVREFGVECKDAHDNKYVFTLRFLEPTGHCKTIEFEFDQLEDTAEAVAGEMMEELSLSKHEADVIVEKITGELNRKAWAIEAARQRQQELGHQSRPPSPSASHVGAATTPAPHAIIITPPPSGYTSGAISPSGPSGERGLVSPPDTPVPHPHFSARRSLPDTGGAAAADRGGQRPQSGPQSPASEGRMLSLNRLVEAMRAVHAENEAAAVAERLIRSTSSTIAFGGAAPGTAAVGRASTGILAPPKPHAAYPLP